MCNIKFFKYVAEKIAFSLPWEHADVFYSLNQMDIYQPILFHFIALELSSNAIKCIQFRKIRGVGRGEKQKCYIYHIYKEIFIAHKYFELYVKPCIAFKQI